MVNGTTLNGTKTLATTASVDETWKFSAQGITMTCTGSTISSVAPEIKPPNSGAATEIVFHECSMNANCTVTKTIGTFPLAVAFELNGTLAAKATFTPKTPGTLIARLVVGGAECAILGLQPVTGKVSASLPTGQDERTLQLVTVNISEASGEVKVGSSSASIRGAVLPRLASSETWSFL
jgi:hypothetical protein